MASWTRLVLCALVSTSAVPAFALEYPCPTDPGFCYFDTGNDGCFDVATDLGPIDDQLIEGFPAPVLPPPGSESPGSIVCPPSVRKLTFRDRLKWSTAPGGSVLIYSAALNAANTNELSSLTIRSGGQLVLGNQLRAGTRTVILRAADDLTIERGVSQIGVPVQSLHVTSENGDVVVAARAVIRGRELQFETEGGGMIEFGDRARVLRPSGIGSPGFIRVLATGDVHLESPSWKVGKGGGSIEVLGTNITMTGKARLKTAGGLIDLSTSPGGEVRVDQLFGTSASEFQIVGGMITIGLPGPSGAVPRSKLILQGPPSIPRRVLVSAEDAVRIENTTFRYAGSLEITSASTSIALLGCAVRDRPNAGAATTLTAAAGSTCDVSGTRFLNSPLTADCDSVIGP